MQSLSKATEFFLFSIPFSSRKVEVRKSDIAKEYKKRMMEEEKLEGEREGAAGEAHEREAAHCIQLPTLGPALPTL